MTIIKVLPHEELCPEGAKLEASPGKTLAEVLLDNKIKIEHACELSCACTTCHVIVRNGFESLSDASDEEEDMLAIELDEQHPDVDPTFILFTDLRKLVLSLEQFSDDPEKTNEKILEAIQMLWIEERE